MKYNKLIFIFFFFLLTNVNGQQPPDKTKIRIVDTLTRQERNNRNPVILKAELDSMIQLHNATLPQTVPQEPVKEIVSEIPAWVAVAGIAGLLIIATLLYLLFGYHKRLTKTVSDLKRLIQNFEFYTTAAEPGAKGPDKHSKGKAALEKKISELTAELNEQKETNHSLMQEYGLIKQTITEVYKVRNYPSFSKEKAEDQIIQDLLKTERSVANHAFEKFLKPVIAIADANKNNPAKISKEDSDKIVELLVSLSLYHTEYLYLRINDLAVGGNIVQRIGSNGKGIDPALLKQLNMEHGSRALVLRMALDKAGIGKLSYPVFDETDLNNY
jgi:Sec-independent protein translocase protein TatA